MLAVRRSEEGQVLPQLVVLAVGCAVVAVSCTSTGVVEVSSATATPSESTTQTDRPEPTGTGTPIPRRVSPTMDTTDGTPAPAPTEESSRSPAGPTGASPSCEATETSLGMVRVQWQSDERVTGVVQGDRTLSKFIFRDDVGTGFTYVEDAKPEPGERVTYKLVLGDEPGGSCSVELTSVTVTQVAEAIDDDYEAAPGPGVPVSNCGVFDGEQFDLPGDLLVVPDPLPEGSELQELATDTLETEAGWTVYVLPEGSVTGGVISEQLTQTLERIAPDREPVTLSPEEAPSLDGLRDRP
jgi:hypothetical protein